MGRDLQKRKRRSSRQPVRQPNRSKKVLNPRGNDAIAKNWNKKETLAQNYRRLGLVARLKAPSGGTEKALHGAAGDKTRANKAGSDPFAIAGIEQAVVSEAKVERDADGHIVRILSHGGANPLNDPLRALDSGSEAGSHDEGGGEEEEEWGGIDDPQASDVVRSLVEASRNPAEKKPRHQSGGEREWLERLVERYGDDAAAMARDRRLNPMQQTAADIAKRLKKMKSAA